MAADMIDANNLQRRVVLNMVMESLLMGKMDLSDLNLSLGKSRQLPGQDQYILAYLYLSLARV